MGARGKERNENGKGEIEEAETNFSSFLLKFSTKQAFYLFSLAYRNKAIFELPLLNP